MAAQPPPPAVEVSRPPLVMDDDEFRAAVLHLFVASDSNLRTFLQRTVRALQEVGRSDIRVQPDTTGAVFTLAQAGRHATGGGTFLERLNLIAPTLQAEAHAARMAIGSICIPDAAEIDAAMRAHQRALELETNQDKEGAPPDGRGGTAQSPPARRRCFPRTEKDAKRESFPTSKYVGNYQLFRYGGAFPPHANFGFYSRYGYDGRGAASSEFHNNPGGERPHRDRIYL